MANSAREKGPKMLSYRARVGHFKNAVHFEPRVVLRYARFLTFCGSCIIFTLNFCAICTLIYSYKFDILLSERGSKQVVGSGKVELGKPHSLQGSVRFRILL